MAQSFCENCGFPLEAGDVFCLNCGAQVRQKAPRQTTPSTPPREYVHPVPTFVPPTRSNGDPLAVAAPGSCPHCGRRREPTWVFCMYCGKRLDEESPTPVLTSVVATEIVNKDESDAYGLDVDIRGLLDDEKEHPNGNDEGDAPATLVYDSTDENDGDVPTMVYQDEELGPTFVMCRRETGEIYRLELPATLGRGKDASVRIEGNPYIGRLHAHLFLLDDELTVEDNGSANGTFVNGKRVEVGTPVQIEEGDVLTLAKEEFDITVE